MDLNHYINGIVENLVKEIIANVSTHVDNVISQSIDSRLQNYDYSTHIQSATNLAIDKKINEYQVDTKKLETRILEKINSTIDSIQANTVSKMNEFIENSIQSTDFNQSMSIAISAQLNDRLKDFVFPNSSISIEAIDLSKSKISGDYISGGIIENFSSTGIDDRSTSVALTILDQATVVENNLFTQDITIQGNLILNGAIPSETNFYQTLVSDAAKTTVESLDQNLFSGYSNLIFNKLRTEGLDLNRITIDGTEVIYQNRLGASVTESNLQKIGALKELQVQGESLLSETLYTTQKRVGINTIEPSAALSIWDNEVEINVSKKRKDTGVIGTPRKQDFIISANGHDNLVALSDGSVQLNNIVLGSIKISSSATPPNFVSDKGHIVFNANPNLGGPLGWVCLGAANWANFGIID